MAQKTDTLVLKDDTRHIGEIKVLSYEKLTFDTWYMGTTKITWTNIKRLMSSKQFTIRTGQGNVYHGSLLDPGKDYHLDLLREEDSSIVELQLGYIVELVPVKRRKIYRFYGSIDLGFSYTKASQVRQYNMGTNVGYRTDDYDFNFIWNDINTFQGDIDRTTIKRDVSLTGTRYMKRAYQTTALVALQKNTELGIDRRTIVGLTAGKGLLQRPRHRITLLLGPIYNNEQYTDERADSTEVGQDQNSMEGVLALDWRAFRYVLPELDFYTQAQYFYSLSEGDRHRINLDFSISYEIIDDVFVTWTLYNNFDSNPPSETASNNDWGTTAGLKYSFKAGQRQKRPKKGRE